MLAELRVIELELQAEVRKRQKAVGLRSEYIETLLAIEKHRRHYEEYLRAVEALFFRNHG